MSESEMSFGEYIESIRKSRRNSLCKTAKAIYMNAVMAYIIIHTIA